MRGMRELPIRCPAGMFIAHTGEGRGAGCRCAIERTVITPAKDERLTSSLVYCVGSAADRVGYTDCPTWRARREAEWEDRHRSMERDVLAGVRRHEE
jgi:hypothetical protein